MPNNKGRKRRFGSIRKTSLGEFQASYLGPDGRRHFAPHRFKRDRDADRWLVQVESLIVSGDWTDPDRAKVALADYAAQWITERPGLRPRTVELYRTLLTKHIVPALGAMQLGRISPADVRKWRADLLAAGTGTSSVAKSYRLLRAVLNTAVEPDNILTRNPCKIPGADKETPAERPVMSVAQVFALADRVGDKKYGGNPRYRMLIVLTAFASLRWGEVTALRRCDITDDCGSLRVTRAHVEIPGQGIVVGPPKSRAGVRTVTIPAAVRTDLRAHLAEFVGSGRDALVFSGQQGRPLRRGNFRQIAPWTKVVADLGMPGLHFHDLRHAGNIWASKAGMSTKDLMARMGHDDMRAALVYQRATSDADEKIADKLSELVDQHRNAEVTATGEASDVE
ncbi:MAG TPA: site-specific integrase [Pseudonocardiaceae bacterium]|nr:site-specific integrase [Pseudonocardiaceae bacterium]